MSARLQIVSAATDHAINLVHYSNWVVARMRAELLRLEAVIAKNAIKALSSLPAKASPVSAGIAVSAAASKDIDSAYATVMSSTQSRAVAIVAPEQGFQASVLSKLGAEPAMIQLEQLAAAVVKRPLMGVTMKKWAQTLSSLARAKLASEVKAGYLLNETIDQIIRRIRGTRAAGYTDGVLKVPRHQAEAIARTMVSQYAASARQAFYERNTDLVAALEWLSTLDSRTTLECIVRDKKQYTIDHQPIGHDLPWGGGPGALHWNCRSTSIPVLSHRIMPPSSVRAAEGGPVAGSMTYAQWFAEQTQERQDEIIGPTRGQLYRDGGLTIDRFVNDQGIMLNLSDLRKREPMAFAMASL